MSAYVQDKVSRCGGRELLMKMDADTFVSGFRFRAFLRSVSKQDTPFLHAAVKSESGSTVERDPTNPWYEPYAKYRPDTWPRTFLGGPGYVLGKAVVKQMIESGVAKKHVLNNEDRAVAVWVDLVMHTNHNRVPVLEREIPGTNGMIWDKPLRKGSWGSFPYALHHHVSPKTIRCLADLEVANDPATPIDRCMSFTSEDDLSRLRSPGIPV
jgi:hypothetical protein